MSGFENDIKNCLAVLNRGGIILYPTDTIWGLGCDATNEKAVQKIYELKSRPEKKGMIILLSKQKEINNYVKKIDEKIVDIIHKKQTPTTVIYRGARNLADNLINEDGSIAIRFVKDEFCQALIDRFEKPIVSTSANISGSPHPASFWDIDIKIKSGVEYIVQHRQNEKNVCKPSAIVKLNEDDSFTVIRE